MTVLFTLSVHMRVNNQQTLKADIEEYVQDDKLRAKMNSMSKTEKGHGRVETRSAYTTDDVEWQPGGHGRLLNALERCIHDLRQTKG